DRWDFAPSEGWPSTWSGTLAPPSEAPPATRIGLFSAWLPYVLVSLLLVLTRTPLLPVGTWLKSVQIQWPGIWGTPITASSPLLYLTATTLLTSAICSMSLPWKRARRAGRAGRVSLKTALSAGFVLLFTIPLLRLYINSGLNAEGPTSMPVMVAGWTAEK